MRASHHMRGELRQMIAVLQAERQALAGLDLDAIMGAAQDKILLCGTLATFRRNANEPTGVDFGQNLINETKSGTVRVGDAVELL